ncbi:MAG: peptidoglycan DD-metalloendopeptidase family protein [Candidatus Limnocylindrales bacterium]|jgi:murein DD-endopeptidase MepM/ murein hydrolase activator NlpD
MTAMHDGHSSRRPNRWRWVQLLLAAALLMPVLGVPAPVAPVRANDLSDAVQQQMALDKLIAEQKKQLATIAAQQAQVKAQMAKTQVNLDQVNQSMDELQGEIETMQAEVDQVQLSYDGLVRQENELQAQVDALEAQSQAKQAELTQRQQILAQRLVAAYKTDQTPLLTQLLTSGSITDVLSDVSYYMDLSAQDQALADQIQEDQRNLARMKQNAEASRISVAQLARQVELQKGDLDGQMTQLTSARAKLASLQRQVATELAKQTAADAKLAKNKAALAAAVKSNGAASAALAAKIDKLAAQLGGSGRIPSAYSGVLQWPMGGKISQQYGCTGWFSEPRVGNCAHFHQGIDIVAPCLTPVHAAGSGVIVFVGYNPYDPPPRAWLVIIAHSTSMVTWYAHMTGKAPAGIHVGAQVSAGQVIGTENTTGHSTGCHLHWAVRVNGVFMNPRLFV